MPGKGVLCERLAAPGSTSVVKEREEYQERGTTMGVRTEHTTRLLHEIATMRRARQALLVEMRRTNELRRVEVSEMLAGFSKARAETGRRMKTDLTTSVRRLRGDVDGLRKEVSADISGIHQAWRGAIPRKPAAIRIQTPPDAITRAEGVEAMDGQPQATAEAEPEEEGTEEVPEAPAEISGAGIKERGTGAAAKTEGRARKKKKRRH
jgi:hypothetical protein